MAVVKIKAEHEGEDVRKLCEEAAILASGNRGELSDGYHTFNDLYKHRIMLFITLASMCAYENAKVYRFHHYEGWFCLGIETSLGQISYHIPESQWDLCAFAEERQPEFDGHTGEDVLERLRKLVEASQPTKENSL